MIRARCHPALAGLLPEPMPASRALPDWFRAMPSEVTAPSLGGETVRTFKHCPPMIDAMSAGIIMPLVTDLTIRDNHLSWDWDPPILDDARISRAPVGLHVPEQTTGAPFRTAANAVIKFLNFWTLEAPEGWSLLFTHPFNREDLPFRTLAGMVDCDLFKDGYVHFPAIWTDANFSGVLSRGTPIAQIIPVPRNGPTLDVGQMSPAQIASNRTTQEALSSDRGVYRKRFRH